MKSGSKIAELYWFNQLSDEAKARVESDAKEHAKTKKVYSVETYKGGMFYKDGRRYSH